MRHLIGLAVLWAFTGSAFVDSSSAEVVYRYATDAVAYEARPGVATEVVVYLEEVLTEGSSSELLAQHGLFSFDVALDTLVAPGSPALVTAATANPDFNGVVNNVPPMILIVDRDLLELEGVQPIAIGPDTYRILLGTFTIEAGDVLGETTTFSVEDFENPLTPGTDCNTFYWDDILAENPLDPLLTSASFSVTVVPEPGTSILVISAGVAMLCLLFRNRCRCLVPFRQACKIFGVFMSLIYTCELCGANPCDYLTELERHAGELASHPQHWMPWNYRLTLDGTTPPPDTAR